jgi:excisionase family DNA binding protein
MAELTVKQAAELAGIPERTMRRWVRSGRVAAVRHGHGYRVSPEAVAAISAGSATLGREAVATTATVVATPAATGPMAESVAELLRMLDQRDRTIMELSGRVGYYQAQVEQLREQLALEAPKAAPVAVEPTAATEAASEPATRPWWRFW